MVEPGLLIEIERKAALWSNVDIAFTHILPSVSDAAKNPLKEEIHHKTIDSIGFYCSATFDGKECRWMELTIEFRNEVERLFRRLKAYRRIFTRYDKLDVVFLSFVFFALIVEALR